MRDKLRQIKEKLGPFCLKKNHRSEITQISSRKLGFLPLLHVLGYLRSCDSFPLSFNRLLISVLQDCYFEQKTPLFISLTIEPIRGARNVHTVIKWISKRTIYCKKRYKHNDLIREIDCYNHKSFHA